MPKKPRRISARISNELKARIARVEDATGLSEAQQIEACVTALVEYFELHGSVTVPLAVVPKKAAAIFPSTARSTPDAASLNEPPPRRTISSTETPGEKYTRIRPRKS